MESVDVRRKNAVNSIKDFEERSISISFIEELFYAIDEHMLYGYVEEMLIKENSTVKFRISRGTRTAGTCGKDGCVYTISISNQLFDGLFKKGEKTLITNGLKCKSRNECLMLTLEHEMVHLITMLIGSDDCHGRIFQCVAKELFEHTDFRHEFTKGDVDLRFNKEDVYVGLVVQTSVGLGTVVKLNPSRAKVYIDGKTWNVPYSGLKIPQTDEIPAPPPVRKPVDKKGIEVGSVVMTGKGIGIVLKRNPKRARVDIDGHIWNIGYGGLEVLSPDDPRYPSKREVEDLNKALKRSNTVDKKGLKIGDWVRIPGKGEGQIEKLNPKRAVVNLWGEKWSVPYSTLIPKKS